MYLVGSLTRMKHFCFLIIAQSRPKDFQNICNLSGVADRPG